MILAPCRVLIVDDSASARQALARIVEGDPTLEVMAVAGDPYAAAEKMRREMPDVILLDVELPRMDGLTFLRKLMAQRPVPVVICSGHAAAGSEIAMQALEAGAVEVIEKPRMDVARGLEEASQRIRQCIRAAAQARLRGAPARALARRPTAPARVASTTVEPRLKADVILAPLSPARLEEVRLSTPRTLPVICVGASTGGTEALRDLLLQMPADAPATVIVQHMPAGFTAAFARRLDQTVAMTVREAADNDELRPGLALIAPGDHHLALRRIGAGYRVRVLDGPFVSRHRPSVDVLFRSAAQGAGPNAVGLIMTGMGDDGADGLAEMRAAGARTLAQDEDSCVVFGMPKEAIARGGVQQQAPLDRLGRLAIAAALDARRTP